MRRLPGISATSCRSAASPSRSAYWSTVRGRGGRERRTPARRGCAWAYGLPAAARMAGEAVQRGRRPAGLRRRHHRHRLPAAAVAAGAGGRLFAPVALTIVFALCVRAAAVADRGAGAVGDPAEGGGARADAWLVRQLARAATTPSSPGRMRNPLKVERGRAAGLVLAVTALHRLGSIFMPVMDEGTPVVLGSEIPDDLRR